MDSEDDFITNLQLDPGWPQANWSGLEAHLSVHGVDEKGGWVYYSGTERSHVGGDVFRVRLDGSARTRLSTAPGTHTASFNPSFTAYIDAWSDANTPQQVRLHRADGSVLGVYPAIYVVVHQDGRWLIAARSSFAP